MSNEVAIIPRESEAQRMFAMIERMATDPQVDPAKLREILSVKQTWEADEARKMFARDMALFQSRCPIIAKADDAYGKKYARIDRIHRETRGLRKECGFWFTWQVCEIRDGMAFMEGLLGHNGGHTVPIKQVIPLPEELKGQNAAQRAGSAMTYAKRYGECLALDIVTGEDDDGNAKPKAAPVGLGDAADRVNKKKLVDLTREVSGVVGYALTDEDKEIITQHLVDECVIEPNETLAELTGKRLAAVVAKLETA